MTELSDDPVERVRAILEAAAQSLGAPARADVTREDDRIQATLEADDAGRLIGRHGRTLDALGVICGQAARLLDESIVRVEVDAAGYREQRRETVEAIADRAADRALAHGAEVALEPMPASERRIIHEHLRDRGGVETYSAGSGPDRHTVVAPISAG